ncbi:MAG: CDP-alcohol phosphatidyltransferase family protein [Thermoplasmatota archaeon]
MHRSNVVHAITLSRLIVVGATYGVVWKWRQPWVVLALVLLAVGTDILDGLLARRWGTVSSLGANLDSAVDFVFYASLVAWVWIWTPSLVLTTLPFVVLFIGLYIGVLTLAKIRRGEMGFHNFWTRLAGTVGVVVSLWIILFGWSLLLGLVLVAALAADLTQRMAAMIRPSMTVRPPATVRR